MTREDRGAIRGIIGLPLLVLFALILLLGANLGLSFVPLGRFNLVVSLLIAATMVGLVGLIFMELTKASGIQKLAAGVGIFWLSFFFLLGFADYLSR